MKHSYIYKNEGADKTGTFIFEESIAFIGRYRWTD